MTSMSFSAAIHRYYWVGIAITFPLVVAANWQALGMQGMIPGYQCFADYFWSGLRRDIFGPDEGACQATFPMWGYGWILFFLQNKLAQLVFQGVLAIVSTVLLTRTLERHALLDDRQLLLCKIGFVLSLPFLAVHALRWPNSISLSLLALFLAFFMEALYGPRHKLLNLILSGLALGIGLNFRSEMIAWPPIFLAFAWFFGWGLRPGRLNFVKDFGAWLVAIYVCLVPWALHSKEFTGRFLLNSSNSGAVFFEGLGSRPDNPWGITLSDGDPRMHREIETAFRPRISPYQAPVDTFLKQRFLDLVAEEPDDYARKVLHDVYLELTGGMYYGEFFNDNRCPPACPGFSTRSLITGGEFMVLPPQANNPSLLDITMTLAGYATGKFLGFIGLVGSGLIFFVSLWRRNAFLFVVTSVAGYISAMMALSAYLSSHMVTAYLSFHLVTFALLGLICSRRRLPSLAQLVPVREPVQR